MTHLDQLKDLLTERLRTGFVIDADAIRHAETFWGMLSIDELQQRLQSDALFDCGLAELLFLPDPQFRERVESTLAPEGVCEKVCQQLINAVATDVVRVPLSIDGCPDPVALTDVETISRILVRALYLTVPVHLPEMDVDAETIARIRAVLRQRGDLTHDENSFVAELLQGFFAAAFVDKALVMQALSYSLGLIRDRAEGGEIFERFALQKTNLQKELAAAEDFRLMFGSRYSMDYLMMSGIKVPTLDETAARDEIFLIDKICFTVYGRAATGLDVIQHKRLELDQADTDVADLLKTL